MEHLLRDIRDVAVGSLSTRINRQLHSLQGLHHRLRDIGAYLQKVLNGELPTNHAILGNLQDIFNLLPNLSTPGNTALDYEEATAAENELARAMSVKTNDQLMAIYIASLIRAIVAFHDLIDNKIQNRQNQVEEQDKEKEKEKKEKDEKDKKENGDKASTEGEGEKGKEGEKKKDTK